MKQIVLDMDRCSGCGKCAAVCAAGALVREKGRLLFSARRCLDECEACRLVCGADAIYYEELDAACGCCSCGGCGGNGNGL